MAVYDEQVVELYRYSVADEVPNHEQYIFLENPLVDRKHTIQPQPVTHPFLAVTVARCPLKIHLMFLHEVQGLLGHKLE